MFKEKLIVLGSPKPDTLCIIVLSVNKQLSINQISTREGRLCPPIGSASPKKILWLHPCKGFIDKTNVYETWEDNSCQYHTCTNKLHRLCFCDRFIAKKLLNMYTCTGCQNLIEKDKHHDNCPKKSIKLLFHLPFGATINKIMIQTFFSVFLFYSWQNLPALSGLS